jgi:hypothetical protein
VKVLEAGTERQENDYCLSEVETLFVLTINLRYHEAKPESGWGTSSQDMLNENAELSDMQIEWIQLLLDYIAASRSSI